MHNPNNTNLAYNYALFDEDESFQKKAEQRSKKQQLKLRKMSIGKSGNAFKTMAVVLVAGVCAFMLLLSKVELSELAVGISDEQILCEEVEAENLRLKAVLDTEMTLNKVEQVAVSELGLQKVQKSQVKYIELNTENIAEVSAEEKNIFVSIGDWFGEVLEFLGF